MITLIVKYCSESWTLDSYVCNRISVFERQIYGCSMCGECLEKNIYIKELNQLHGELDVMANIRLGRLK